MTKAKLEVLSSFPAHWHRARFEGDDMIGAERWRQDGKEFLVTVRLSDYTTEAEAREALRLGCLAANEEFEKCP